MNSQLEIEDINSINESRIICKRLKGLMAEYDFTTYSLSKKIGISQQSLMLKIDGQSEWYYGELISIVKQLGMSEVKEVFPELYNKVLSMQ